MFIEFSKFTSFRPFFTWMVDTREKMVFGEEGLSSMSSTDLSARSRGGQMREKTLQPSEKLDRRKEVVAARCDPTGDKREGGRVHTAADITRNTKNTSTQKRDQSQRIHFWTFLNAIQKGI